MDIKKLALFLLLLGCASVDKDKHADFHTKIGIGYLNVGNYPEAYRSLIKAKELTPEDPRIYNSLGLVSFHRKRYEKSINFLTNAVKLDPNYTEARNNLARTYIETKNFDKAKKLLLVVINDLTFRTPEKAHDYLGLLYLKQGNLSESIVEFRKAIELNNKYCPAWYNYAMAQYDNKKFKETSRSLDLYTKMCGVYEDVLYYGGLSYYKSGNNRFSRKFLRNLIRNFPNSRHVEKSARILKSISPRKNKKSDKF